MRTFTLGLIAMMLLASPLWAQKKDLDVALGGSKSRSYSYNEFPFPPDMLLWTLEKEKLTFRPEGLSLVTVFGLCCGAEPFVWNRVNELASRYKDQGLNTYMINFENGGELASQLRDVKKFLESNTRPDNILIDGMGYTVDLLQVNGFPTYYLVDANGNVVFQTNGKDEEGLAILESEILSRI